MLPTPDQALQFVLIISSGMPSLEALRYFEPDLGPDELMAVHDKWVRSAEVRKATLKVQGKAWQDMSLEEKIKYAIEKHYAEMAYFLYAHNYSDLVSNEKAKADTCRQSLEAKLAGMAGKLDALSMFLQDVKTGTVKLPSLARIGTA